MAASARPFHAREAAWRATPAVSPAATERPGPAFVVWPVVLVRPVEFPQVAALAAERLAPGGLAPAVVPEAQPIAPGELAPAVVPEAQPLAAGEFAPAVYETRRFLAKWSVPAAGSEAQRPVAEASVPATEPAGR